MSVRDSKQGTRGFPASYNIETSKCHHIQGISKGLCKKLKREVTVGRAFKGRNDISGVNVLHTVIRGNFWDLGHDRAGLCTLVLQPLVNI